MIEKIQTQDLTVRHLSRPVTLRPGTIHSQSFVLGQILARAGGRAGPEIRLRGSDLVTYPAQDHDRIHVEWPDPPSRDIVIVRDETGVITDLRCPNPSCSTSDIAEVDTSVRWNTIEVEADGALAVHEADIDHQHSGWVCRHCGWDLTSDLDSSDLAW